MKNRSLAIAVLSTTLGIAVVHATDAVSALRWPSAAPTTAVTVPAQSVNVQVTHVLSTTSGPVVLLKADDTSKYLPIWIGQDQAHAIERSLDSVDMPRPMTHDLFVNVLGELETKIAHVRVDTLRADGVYIGTITVVGKDGVMQIDARPSDALALAVRVGAPIYIDASLRPHMIETAVE